MNNPVNHSFALSSPPPWQPSAFGPVSPLQSLHDSAYWYAKDLADELGADQDMVACALLAMFAAAIGPDVSCKVWEAYEVELSLLMAVGAPSGTGKSPIISRMLRVLQGLVEKHLLFTQEQEQLATANMEVLESAIRKLKLDARSAKTSEERGQFAKLISNLVAEKEQGRVPVSPFLGQISIPSLVKELSYRRAGFGVSIDAEGGILALLNTVSVDRITPLLRAWSNEDLSDVTKEHEFRVKKPRLVALAMWQDAPLLSVLRNKNYRSIGLVARILPYVVTECGLGRGCGLLSRANEGWYENQLEKVLKRQVESSSGNSSRLNFTLSGGALKQFQAFKQYLSHIQMAGGAFCNFKDVATKLDVQAIRLALVLQAVELKDPADIILSEDIMFRACCLAMFFGWNLQSILSAADFNDGNEDERRLAQVFARFQRSYPRGIGLPVNDLRRPLGMSKPKCERLLFEMMNKGYVSNQYATCVLPSGRAKYVELWVPQVDFSACL